MNIDIDMATLKDFAQFRRMITPLFIQIIFWVAVVSVVLAGLFGLILGDGAIARITGLVTIFVGPLVVRVYAEILIIIFRINETLTEIRNQKQEANASNGESSEA